MEVRYKVEGLDIKLAELVISLSPTRAGPEYDRGIQVFLMLKIGTETVEAKGPKVEAQFDLMPELKQWVERLGGTLDERPQSVDYSF